jgi:hypothetical protein
MIKDDCDEIVALVGTGVKSGPLFDAIVARHPSYADCVVPECPVCGYRDCGWRDLLHHSQGGCPSCDPEDTEPQY